MQSLNPNKFGKVVLRYKWWWIFSLLIIVVASIVGIGFAYISIQQSSMTLKVLTALVALLGAVSAIAGIRNFIHPRIIFEITDKGILFRNDGAHRVLDTPFFIPWRRVASLEYEKVRTLIDGRSGWSRRIAVKVKADENWSPAGVLINCFDEARGVVWLDTETGYPRHETLFHQVELLRKRYS